MKKYFSTILILIIIIVTYFIINYSIGKDNFNSVKNLISDNNKQLIKKYIFPYKLIDEQKNDIFKKNQELILKNEVIKQKEGLIKNLIKPSLNDELIFKKQLTHFSNKNYREIKLNKNLYLKKYEFLDGFYSGINEFYPGSGYLDFYDNKLIVLSSRGIIAYETKDEKNQKYFKQIKNNIEKFINKEQFKKNKWFSLKDLFISDNKIFVSYTEEIEENCWNTSLLSAKINLQNIFFKKIFSSDKCVHSKNNIDNEFNAHQSGGRIYSLDKNNIIFTIGDYRNRFLAQDDKSLNGKIIQINLKNNKYKIFSKGHRNPQGLFYDKENKFILSTEHGPFGGDEINLIKLNQNSIQNFGWPIASYGLHYSDPKKIKIKKYPLLKSHQNHGFIEPLKYFVPSIGISEIVKIGEKKYVTSSMKDKSLYFFELSEMNKLINMKRVQVFERVRDLIFKNQKLYLFLENTGSLGIIELKGSNV